MRRYLVLVWILVLMPCCLLIGLVVWNILSTFAYHESLKRIGENLLSRLELQAVREQEAEGNRWKYSYLCDELRELQRPQLFKALLLVEGDEDRLIAFCTIVGKNDLASYLQQRTFEVPTFRSYAHQMQSCSEQREKATHHEAAYAEILSQIRPYRTKLGSLLTLPFEASQTCVLLPFEPLPMIDITEEEFLLLKSRLAAHDQVALSILEREMLPLMKVCERRFGESVRAQNLASEICGKIDALEARVVSEFILLVSEHVSPRAVRERLSSVLGF